MTISIWFAMPFSLNAHLSQFQIRCRRKIAADTFSSSVRCERVFPSSPSAYVPSANAQDTLLFLVSVLLSDDLRAKRHQRQLRQLKKLLPERNSNNRDAPKAADDQIRDRHFQTEKNDPDHIHQKRKHAAAVYDFLAERPHRQRCKLKALQPDRDPDDRDAPDQPCQQP